jgi:hypothetical protein
LQTLIEPSFAQVFVWRNDQQKCLWRWGMLFILLAAFLIGTTPALGLMRRTSKDPKTGQIKFVDPYPVALTISLAASGIAFFVIGAVLASRNIPKSVEIRL